MALCFFYKAIKFYGLSKKYKKLNKNKGVISLVKTHQGLAK
jgi:hypothetical protein